MAEAPFWGYWPKYLLAAGWLFILLCLTPLLRKVPNHWELTGLSLGAGLLLALAWNIELINGSWIVFAGFVPLLIIERILSKTKLRRPKLTLWFYAYNTFIVWNILATYWVANSALAAGLFAIIVNSFLMTLPLLGYHFIRKYLKDQFAFPAFAGLWLTFEFLHLQWELSWPWLTIGNVFSIAPKWIQWYEVTGVFGGGLWILGMNYLIFRIIVRKYELNQAIKKQLIYTAALFVIPILVSYGIYYTYEEVGEPAEVVLIQPNYEPHYKKFTVSANEQFQTFKKLSEQSVDENTDYLVFPETSFRSVNRKLPLIHPQVKALQSFVKDFPKLHLVTGIASYQIFRDELPDEYRTDIRNGDTIHWQSYNAAIQLEQDLVGQPELYLKSKLVPGAESFPYKWLFFFMSDLVDQLGGTDGGVTGQPERSLFHNDEWSIAPVICYESIYGGYCTEYIRKGADALFIVTNDGWWDNTDGHRQHLRYGALRAIETRRSIARSANTGVSCFINQRGDILQPTNYEEATFVKGTILMNDTITFYTKWGDLIARIAGFLSILLLLNAFVKSRKAA